MASEQQGPRRTDSAAAASVDWEMVLKDPLPAEVVHAVRDPTLLVELSSAADWTGERSSSANAGASSSTASGSAGQQQPRSSAASARGSHAAEADVVASLLAPRDGAVVPPGAPESVERDPQAADSGDPEERVPFALRDQSQKVLYGMVVQAVLTPRNFAANLPLGRAEADGDAELARQRERLEVVVDAFDINRRAHKAALALYQGTLLRRSRKWKAELRAQLDTVDKWPDHIRAAFDSAVEYRHWLATQTASIHSLLLDVSDTVDKESVDDLEPASDRSLYSTWTAIICCTSCLRDPASASVSSGIGDLGGPGGGGGGGGGEAEMALYRYGPEGCATDLLNAGANDSAGPSVRRADYLRHGPSSGMLRSGNEKGDGGGRGGGPKPLTVLGAYRLLYLVLVSWQRRRDNVPPAEDGGPDFRSGGQSASYLKVPLQRPTSVARDVLLQFAGVFRVSPVAALLVELELLVLNVSPSEWYVLAVADVLSELWELRRPSAPSFTACTSSEKRRLGLAVSRVLCNVAALLRNHFQALPSAPALREALSAIHLSCSLWAELKAERSAQALVGADAAARRALERHSAAVTSVNRRKLMQQRTATSRRVLLRGKALRAAAAVASAEAGQSAHAVSAADGLQQGRRRRSLELDEDLLLAAETADSLSDYDSSPSGLEDDEVSVTAVSAAGAAAGRGAGLGGAGRTRRSASSVVSAARGSAVVDADRRRSLASRVRAAFVGIVRPLLVRAVASDYRALVTSLRHVPGPRVSLRAALPVTDADLPRMPRPLPSQAAVANLQDAAHALEVVHRLKARIASHVSDVLPSSVLSRDWNLEAESARRLSIHFLLDLRVLLTRVAPARRPTEQPEGGGRGGGGGGGGSVGGGGGGGDVGRVGAGGTVEESGLLLALHEQVQEFVREARAQGGLSPALEAWLGADHLAAWFEAATTTWIDSMAQNLQHSAATMRLEELVEEARTSADALLRLPHGPNERRRLVAEFERAEETMHGGEAALVARFLAHEDPRGGSWGWVDLPFPGSPAAGLRDVGAALAKRMQARAAVRGALASAFADSGVAEGDLAADSGFGPLVAVARGLARHPCEIAHAFIWAKPQTKEMSEDDVARRLDQLLFRPRKCLDLVRNGAGDRAAAAVVASLCQQIIRQLERELDGTAGGDALLHTQQLVRVQAVSVSVMELCSEYEVDSHPLTERVRHQFGVLSQGTAELVAAHTKLARNPVRIVPPQPVTEDAVAEMLLNPDSMMSALDGFLDSVKSRAAEACDQAPYLGPSRILVCLKARAQVDKDPQAIAYLKTLHQL